VDRLIEASEFGIDDDEDGVEEKEEDNGRNINEQELEAVFVKEDED